MKTETVQELYDFLAQVIKDGHGDAEILFDTEARTFNYHMAKVGSAYCQPEIWEGLSVKGFVDLHEKR